MREMEKAQENQTMGQWEALTYKQQREAVLACVKFSSNFDRVQRSKRNYIRLLFIIQIIFTSLLALKLRTTQINLDLKQHV